jgi:hypothetical protein
VTLARGARGLPKIFRACGADPACRRPTYKKFLLAEGRTIGRGLISLPLPIGRQDPEGGHLHHCRYPQGVPAGAGPGRFGGDNPLPEKRLLRPHRGRSVPQWPSRLSGDDVKRPSLRLSQVSKRLRSWLLPGGRGPGQTIPPWAPCWLLTHRTSRSASEDGNGYKDANRICSKQMELLGQLIASGDLKPPAGWWNPTTTTGHDETATGHGNAKGARYRIRDCRCWKRR